MAIALVGVGSVAGTSNATNATVTLHGSSAIDDYVYFFVAANGNLTLTQPAALTVLTETSTANFSHGVYRLKLASGFATTYNFSWGSSVQHTVIAATYRGVDLTTPEDVALVMGAEETTATPYDYTLAGLTTATDAAWHIGVAVQDGSADYDATPSGYTEDARVAGRRMSLAHKVITPAGATGSLTWSTDGVTPIQRGYELALRPAAAGGTVALSGGSTIDAPSSAGALAYRSVSALSGTGEVAAPTSAGSLAYRSASSLSGSADLPGLTSAGDLVVAPVFALSGSGELVAPSSSGTLTFTAAGVSALSGTGELPVPGSAGALAYRSVSALSGASALPAPTSAGVLAYCSLAALSGGGAIPVFGSSGLLVCGTIAQRAPVGGAIRSVVVNGGALGLRVDGGWRDVVVSDGGLTMEVR